MEFLRSKMQNNVHEAVIPRYYILGIYQSLLISLRAHSILGLRYPTLAMSLIIRSLYVFVRISISSTTGNS